MGGKYIIKQRYKFLGCDVMNKKRKGFSVMVTRRCNLACGFCLRGKKRDESIGLDILERICLEAKGLGYSDVALTGGEACLHPEFGRLLDIIGGVGLRYSLISNGLAYEYRDQIREHKEVLNHITISLDSHLEEVHDILRGRGVYGKAIRAVEWSIGEGIRTWLQIVVNRYNRGEIGKYIGFAKGLGVERVRIAGVIPRVWTKNIELSMGERESVGEEIEVMRKDGGIIVDRLSSSHVSLKKCEAWESEGFVVSEDGKMLFCCDLEGEANEVGSFSDNRLDLLLEKREKMGKYLKRYYGKEASGCEGASPCEICYRCLEGYGEESEKVSRWVAAVAAGLLCVNALDIYGGVVEIDIRKEGDSTEKQEKSIMEITQEHLDRYSGEDYILLADSTPSRKNNSGLNARITTDEAGNVQCSVYYSASSFKEFLNGMAMPFTLWRNNKATGKTEILPAYTRPFRAGGILSPEWGIIASGINGIGYIFGAKDSLVYNPFADNPKLTSGMLLDQIVAGAAAAAGSGGGKSKSSGTTSTTTTTSNASNTSNNDDDDNDDNDKDKDDDDGGNSSSGSSGAGSGSQGGEG